MSMKLYFSPFSCALAARIAAVESGQQLEFEQIDLATKKVADGGDYHAINGKGLVPALVLADDTLITESAAVLQFIADRAPGSGLAPPCGTMERVKLQTWLHYIGAECHKIVFTPIFRPDYPDAFKNFARSLADERFAFLSGELADRTWLLGDQFTVADAYLAVMLFWVEPAGLSLEKWPVLEEYRIRLRARPSVGGALAEELARRHN
ncbi:MAG: glutathione binding-like protein [Sphingopyxis solisilvae]|uniref:glutathione binding-like protein n=2 Tax=Sphingopyxis solisilvae TaxID=1886788 RepID=UPI0040356FD9